MADVRGSGGQEAVGADHGEKKVVKAEQEPVNPTLPKLQVNAYGISNWENSLSSRPDLLIPNDKDLVPELNGVWRW